MREEWIDIHPGDGTLVVPDTHGDNCMAWLVIDNDEILHAYGIDDSAPMAFWASNRQFYGTPVESIDGLLVGCAEPEPTVWTRADERLPKEGEKVYLVLDTTSSDLYFSPGKDIGKSGKLYWYDGFVRATLHKRKKL